MGDGTILCIPSPLLFPHDFFYHTKVKKYQEREGDRHKGEKTKEGKNLPKILLNGDLIGR